MAHTSRLYFVLVALFVLSGSLACIGSSSKQTRSATTPTPIQAHVLDPHPGSKVLPAGVRASLEFGDEVQQYARSSGADLNSLSLKSKPPVDIKQSIVRGFENLFVNASEDPLAPYTLRFEKVRVERQASQFGLVSHASLFYLARWYDADERLFATVSGRAMSPDLSVSYEAQLEFAIESMLEEATSTLSKKLQQDEVLQQAMLVPRRDVERALSVAQEEAEDTVRPQDEAHRKLDTK